jgi:hypothetical protein
MNSLETISRINGADARKGAHSKTSCSSPTGTSNHSPCSSEFMTSSGLASSSLRKPGYQVLVELSQP